MSAPYDGALHLHEETKGQQRFVKQSGVSENSRKSSCTYMAGSQFGFNGKPLMFKCVCVCMCMHTHAHVGEQNISNRHTGKRNGNVLSEVIKS